jgi:predicted phage terminase large subunit-like protein
MAMTRKNSSSDILNDTWRLYPHTYAMKCSQGAWVPYKYLVYLSKRLREAVIRGNGRIIVSLPPRVGKSLFISKWFPAWFLDLFPEKSVIITSNESSLAEDYGREVRDHFVNGLGWTDVREDVSAAKRWKTPEGGSMIAQGVGGNIMGKGGSLLIVDDPYSTWEDANSPSFNRRLRDWFNSAFYTRREPGATIVVLHHRWSEIDLTEYLQTEHADKWETISFPAICDDVDDLLGREIGQSLCPERFSEEDFARTRASVTETMWSALYQQKPAPPGGAIWKRSWWRYWHMPNKALPPVTTRLEDGGFIDCPTAPLPMFFDKVLQSWDLSFKDTKNAAYVVGQVWGAKGPDRFLLDQVRARLDLPGTINAIRRLSEKWPMAIEKVIEDAANGPAVMQSMRNELSGILLASATGPLGSSKEARAHAAAPMIKSGNVYLPHPRVAGWVDGFLNECSKFPNSKYKDQVDAAAQAILRMLTATWKPTILRSPTRRGSNVQGTDAARVALAERRHTRLAGAKARVATKRTKDWLPEIFTRGEDTADQ